MITEREIKMAEVTNPLSISQAISINGQTFRIRPHQKLILRNSNIRYNKFGLIVREKECLRGNVKKR